MRTGSMKRTGEADRPSGMAPVLSGLIVSLIVTMVMVILGGVAMTLVGSTDSGFVQAGSAAIAVASGLGGLYAGHAARQNGLRNGALVGAIYFVLLLVIGFLTVREPVNVIVLGQKAVLSLVPASIGGVLGVNF